MARDGELDVHTPDLLADGRSEQPTALQLLPRRPAVASAIRAMLSVLSTRNATSTWDEKERTGGLAALGKYMDCGDSVLSLIHI